MAVRQLCNLWQRRTLALIEWNHRMHWGQCMGVVLPFWSMSKSFYSVFQMTNFNHEGSCTYLPFVVMAHELDQNAGIFVSQNINISYHAPATMWDLPYRLFQDTDHHTKEFRVTNSFHSCFIWITNRNITVWGKFELWGFRSLGCWETPPDLGQDKTSAGCNWNPNYDAAFS